jgi:hypothetical protein
MAQPVTTWGELKQIVRELKKPEVKAVYQSIIIDTADIAADACQKYICNQLGIENIGDGGWTNNGWAKYKKEFEETFRTLTQLGYAVVFLSHVKEKTIKSEGGAEYTQIGSSMQSSALAIIENMSDIIGYAHTKVDASGEGKVVLTLRSSDGSVRCGGRFKYIAPEIDFSYDALTNALNQAIDKEAAETNNQFVTDERQTAPVIKEYDYDALMEEFQTMVGKLMEGASGTANGPKITQIIEKYLGKGKKISETTRDQAEFIYLIVTEIKEDLM